MSHFGCRMGLPGKIVFLPLPGDDPKQRRPNITRAKALLEWEPKVLFDGRDEGRFPSCGR